MSLFERIRKYSRQVNDFVIVAVLTVFYCTVFGVIAVYYKISRVFYRTPKQSYWISADNSGHYEEYFKSPY